MPTHTDPVRDPKWTGEKRELAIGIGYGQPTRTPERQHELLRNQLARYLVKYPPSGVVITTALVDATAAAIAKDYIEGRDGQAIRLMFTRAEILKWIETTRSDMPAAPVMKTREQIRARMELLQDRIDNKAGIRRTGAALLALVNAEDALRWVLGEYDTDSALPSLQQAIDGER